MPNQPEVTHSRILVHGPYGLAAECACGWEGPWRSDIPAGRDLAKSDYDAHFTRPLEIRR